MECHNSNTSEGQGVIGQDEETSLTLLGHTQDYLRQLVEAQNPNTLLCDSWSEFYRVYNDLIRRYVLSRRIPASDVEDCVQEVWVAVAKNLAEFEHPRNRPGLRAWLYTLVRSKTADVMRRRCKHSAMSLDAICADQGDPASPDTPGDVWHRVFLETVLAEVLAEESEENIRIMNMRLVHNFRSAEIAERLGLSKRVVRYRLNRMRQRVKVRIAFYSGEPLGSAGMDSETKVEPRDT
jgi:RNA polymerase sigma factor (sigma-70 family)